MTPSQERRENLRLQHLWTAQATLEMLGEIEEDTEAKRLGKSLNRYLKRRQTKVLRASA